MGILYYDYKFKSKENQDKWDDILKNVYHYMKLDFTKNGVNVYSQIRRMYNITPARLKKDGSDAIKNIRNFTLYMLVHFSKQDLKEIANEFVDVTIKDLEMIKNDKTLDLKYDEEIKMFLDYYKEDYLSNTYQCMAASEEMMHICEMLDC